MKLILRSDQTRAQFDWIVEQHQTHVTYLTVWTIKTINKWQDTKTDPFWQGEDSFFFWRLSGSGVSGKNANCERESKLNPWVKIEKIKNKFNI